VKISRFLPFACSHRFYLSNRYEHAKIQLLLIKFNTRTLGKKYTLSSSDVDFETFGVLGTTLNEICYVKFEMAKSRCRAKAFLNVRKLKACEEKGQDSLRISILRVDARPCLYVGYYTALE